MLHYLHQVEPNLYYVSSIGIDIYLSEYSDLQGIFAKIFEYVARFHYIIAFSLVIIQFSHIY